MKLFVQVIKPVIKKNNDSKEKTAEKDKELSLPEVRGDSPLTFSLILCQYTKS